MTSKDRASFIEALKTEYKDVAAIYRHFKGGLIDQQQDLADPG